MNQRLTKCAGLFAVLLTLAPTSLSIAQKRQRPPLKRPPFHEELAPLGSPTEVPAAGIQQVRQFIQYIILAKPDIATDSSAQQRFLSKAMQAAFANRRAVYAEFAKHNDTPDLPPDNGAFVGAWDPPTSFRIVGSRLYDERAVVDVVFSWGKNTNYEGDTRLTSYLLIREQNNWKVCDIYVWDGDFESASSLIEVFRREKY
jgi:hypothetical protein